MGQRYPAGKRNRPFSASANSVDGRVPMLCRFRNCNRGRLSTPGHARLSAYNLRFLFRGLYTALALAAFVLSPGALMGQEDFLVEDFESGSLGEFFNGHGVGQPSRSQQLTPFGSRDHHRLDLA